MMSIARDLIKKKLLTEKPNARYSMVNIIKCSPWLHGFIPHCGWSAWFVNRPTPPSKAKAKDKTPGRIRYRTSVSRVTPMETLREESSSSDVAGGGIDTEMMPATPLRRVLRSNHAVEVKPSPYTLRSNMRRRAVLESKGKK